MSKVLGYLASVSSGTGFLFVCYILFIFFFVTFESLDLFYLEGWVVASSPWQVLHMQAGMLSLNGFGDSLSICFLF